MIQIPALRMGKAYTSLEKATIKHHVTGEPVAEVSMVNGSMIARDLASKAAKARKELAAIPIADLVEMYSKAADHFINDTLPVGDSEQTFDDYIRCLSATTGSPMVFCKKNASKVEYVLRNVEEVLGGLTRGMDLSVLDTGYSMRDGRMTAFYPCGNSFGAVLPSNSPGVHSLWVPTLALKTPLILKPGREEPWTPYRVLQAFIKAGLPESAMGFYPTDHAGAADLLRVTNRSMLFGDSRTTDPYKSDTRVELHGPGFSKILIGEDYVDRYEDFIDEMVESIAANGGRSCINVSGVWAPRRGREIAEALADRLAQIEPRPWDAEDAKISAFAKPEVAEAINGMLEEGLKTPGATDVVLEKRGTPRLHHEGRIAYILPAVVYCEDTEHPLANKEFLFPYASVVECPQAEMVQKVGPTLAAMALTDDDDFVRELLDSPHIERLNLGPIPTSRLTWDQPHEGNLFTHLYRQRALQIRRQPAAAAV